MKKILAFLGAVLAGTFAFSQDYLVKTVTGKVTYEAAGKKADVKEGQTLSGSTVINTGINSKLVVQDSNGEITIKAMQNGTLECLVNANACKSGGIKKNPAKASSSEIGSETESAQGVGTASSRASSAQDDVEWDE